MGEAPHTPVDPLEVAELHGDANVWAIAYIAAIPLAPTVDDYNAFAVQMADDALREWRNRNERGL